jgi:hypothetical protein
MLDLWWDGCGRASQSQYEHAEQRRRYRFFINRPSGYAINIERPT